MQYKTVAGPVGLTIQKKDSYSDAVKQYASIIGNEAVGGWELDCIQQIPVTKQAGCMSGLAGQPDTTVYFNMLVFKKEDQNKSLVLCGEYRGFSYKERSDVVVQIANDEGMK